MKTKQYILVKNRRLMSTGLGPESFIIGVDKVASLDEKADWYCQAKLVIKPALMGQHFSVKLSPEEIKNGQISTVEIKRDKAKITGLIHIDVILTVYEGTEEEYKKHLEEKKQKYLAMKEAIDTSKREIAPTQSSIEDEINNMFKELGLE